MPTPKRVFLIVVRCIPIVVALGFLAFYVGSAQIRRSEMLSSSKNLRALSTAAEVTRYLSAEPASTVPANSPSLPPGSASEPTLPMLSPPVSSSSESALPTHASDENQQVLRTFRFGLLPDRPLTLGGSKSASRVVQASDLSPFWNVATKAIYHTYDLPLLRALPHEMTFGKPTVRVHTEVVAEGEDPEFPAAFFTPASPPTPAILPPASADSSAPSDAASTPEPAPETP